MGSEWKEFELGQLLDVVTDIYKPNKKEVLPYLGLEHIEQGTLRLSGIGMSTDIISNKYRFEPNDILFGKLRPYFRKVYKPRFSGVCSTDIMVLRTKDCNIADQSFLFYVIASKKFIDIATASSKGTKMPRADWNHLKKVMIKLPSLPEQRKIASILSAFDDKIELNNEINKILQEIAQAIFKHWFIDFEFPNENGAPYKSSGGEFVDSELGPIPKGWKVGTLKEICHINMGQSPPSSTYNTEGVGIAFYQGVKDFGFRYPSCTIYCSEPKKIAEMGDILLSVRAPVGEVNIAIEKCCIGRGLCSLRMKEGSNNYLYYLLLNQKKNWTKFESGSVFTAINKASIENLPIICPPNYIYREFNELVQPVDEKILNNTKMNIFLSQLSDTLHPKLISGEIRVV